MHIPSHVIRKKELPLNPQALNKVTETRNKLSEAQREHHEAIINAKSSGESVVDITRESAYKSRKSIYDILKKKE